jgi:subtilisin
MARKHAPRAASEPGSNGGEDANGTNGADSTTPGEFRPGVLITFRQPGETVRSTLSGLRNRAGLANVAHANDYEDHAVNLADAQGSDMVVFDSLGVAVCDVDPSQMSALSAMVADSDSAVETVEPEPIFFAFADGISSESLSYLRGYHEAVEILYQKLAGPSAAILEDTSFTAEVFQDSAAATWGLAATKVLQSPFSGRGIKVAVLDTGMDLDHPDFRGRSIVSRSFIPQQDVQDENGHGTHCIGTACGPRQPVRGRRYGIAYESEIFVGKVLSNQGSSLGRSTLAGIEWAVQSGCHIVSMSLGGRVLPGQSFSPAFESAAREAIRRDTLVIAAAGNESRRSQGQRNPVGSPANCPSVMAVAAVDRFLRIADFSNAARNTDGKVDIAGPGVEVYSSAPEPAAPRQPPFFRQWSAQYDTISGTSMATPHVSGIAALLRQSRPQMTAGELWRLLTSKALRLSLPADDVGSGLVQA